MLIPAGCLAKKVVTKLDWLKAKGIEDINSVSGCISKDFADYITFWKYTGYWFFYSPEVIEQVAGKQASDLAGRTMFDYEVYEQEFEDRKRQWCPYKRESSFFANVRLPEQKTLAGFEVANSVSRNSPEGSPPSCNSLANAIQTNAHCLLPDFETTRLLVETGKLTSKVGFECQFHTVGAAVWL